MGNIQRGPTSINPELVVFVPKKTYKVGETITVQWRNWNITPSDQNRVQIDITNSSGSCGGGFTLDTTNQTGTTMITERPCGDILSAGSGSSSNVVSAIEGNPYKITGTFFGPQGIVLAESSPLFITIK